jgi:broad specificity phosphatase PhoE
MPRTVVYLARHGQSAWNHQSRVTGQLDPGLSPTGEEQALAIARCLRSVALDAVYASTLERTRATAAPTAARQGLAVQQERALAEIHMGVLQGRWRDERDPEAQALWNAWQADPWGPAVPGGETMAALAARVGSWLDAALVRHAGQRLLVVGHRATNRVLLGRLLGRERGGWLALGQRSKHLYRIELEPGRAAVVETHTLSGAHAGRVKPGLVT